MDKISSIKHRILYFIENQRIKKETFYKDTGFSASNFRGTSLNSEIGGDKIVVFLTVYKDVSLEWLIFGKGDMIKSNTYQSKTETTEVAEPKPIYNNNVETEKIAFYKEQIEFYKNAYHETKEKLTNCENEKKLQKTR